MTRWRGSLLVEGRLFESRRSGLMISILRYRQSLEKLENDKLVNVFLDGRRPLSVFSWPSLCHCHRISIILLRNSQWPIGLLLTRQRIPVYATDALQEGLGRAFSFHTRRTCTAPRLALVPQALHAAACVVLPLTALQG